MVLPPTVAGYFLLLLFSKRRPLGIFLFSHFGIKVVQSFLGCVLAATVISLPLMYRNAKASFALVTKDLVQAARTLGLSETKILEDYSAPFRAGNSLRRGFKLCQSAGGVRSHLYAGR